MTRRSGPISIPKAARVLLVVVFAGSLWQISQLKTETDITRFMPSGERSDHLSLSKMVGATGMGRNMILAIGVPGELDREEAIGVTLSFSQELISQLNDTKHFKTIRNGVDEATFGEDIYDLYFSRRFGLLSSDPEREIPQLFSAEGLADRLENLRVRLSLPTAGPVRHLAPRDPIMAFWLTMEHLQSVGAKMAPRMVQGHYFSQEEDYHLIFAQTEAEAFDTVAQQPALESLERTFRQINARHGDMFSLSYTGLNRFMVEGERRIRADITQTALLSTVGVLLLFVLFFRKLSFLFFAFSPTLFGVAVALGITQLLMGSVHGLTLAFGATLIGVSIDYPVHMLNHLRFPRSIGPAGAGGGGDDDMGSSWRRLHYSLSIGLVTTLAGYYVLLASSFPGIREIALFSSTGILASFLFTLLFLPLAKGMIKPKPEFGGTITGKGYQWLRWGRFWTRYRGGRRVCLATYAFGGLVLMASLLALPFVDLETDIRSLTINDPKTAEEDERVRSHLPSAQYPLVVLTWGETMEEALQKNDGLYGQLGLLGDQNLVDDFVSVSPFLPSQALQVRNLAQVGLLQEVAEQVETALDDKGFRPEMFRGFLDDLASLSGAKSESLPDGMDPITPEKMGDTSLRETIQGFLFHAEDRAHVLSLVKPASGSQEQLVRALEGTDPNLAAFDHVSLLSGLVTDSKREIIILFLIGIFANVMILVAYRRSIRGVFELMLPALLALLSMVGGMALWGVRLNILHMMSLLLVLSAGVDYAVFLGDSLRKGNEHDVSVASLSVLFSAGTTFVAFGALALCSTPALGAIGGTVATGIVLTCLYSFAMGLVAHKPPLTAIKMDVGANNHSPKR